MKKFSAIGNEQALTPNLPIKKFDNDLIRIDES